MHESIQDALENILTSIHLIQRRFKGINSPDDFLSEADGLFTLDAIAMRLQIIGENVRSLSKLDLKLLEKHSEVEWQNIMRLRDLISHHYDVLDHEIIYDICSEHIPVLRRVIEEMAGD
jgi:uncharacterized protein with HEPN domain